MPLTFRIPQRRTAKRAPRGRWGRLVSLRKMSYRRKGRARPSRSLRTSYSGAPNQYRFVRESLPVVVDINNQVHPQVTVLAGTAAVPPAPDIPNMSLLRFDTFTMNALVNFTTEFGKLFTQFHLDKLEIVMIPMWEQTNNQYQLPLAPPAAGQLISNLMCTRVNSQYEMQFSVPADANLARTRLAQLQMKTRTLYGSKKWLRLTTTKPKVIVSVQDGAGGTNDSLKSPGWQNIATASDQQYCANDHIYLDRLDGANISPVTGSSVYKYRFYYRAHFRVSRVQ